MQQLNGRIDRRGETVHEIELEFSHRGVVKGQTLYLKPEIARQMVDLARRRGVRILGLDAVVLSQGVTQPFLEESLDLSAITKTNPNFDSWVAAADFLENHVGREFMFEVILE
jgi:hypothetical protein